MLELAIQWKDFLNPEYYIQHGGLWLFLFIVFAETGLFAGFFLPGDSRRKIPQIKKNKSAGLFCGNQRDKLIQSVRMMKGSSSSVGAIQR
jgi:hypothetical protein